MIDATIVRGELYALCCYDPVCRVIEETSANGYAFYPVL